MFDDKGVIFRIADSRYGMHLFIYQLNFFSSPSTNAFSRENLSN